MKKFMLLLLCLLLPMSALCGCGNTSKLDPDNPVTLSIWHVYGSQTESPLNDAIHEFNQTTGKELGVIVNVISVMDSDSIDDTLIASANNIPGSVPLPDLFTAYPRVAEKIGYVIKLIGAAEIDDNSKISAMVAPRLVPNTSLLSGVNDVFNAILVHGDSLDDAIFYGRGAGKLPTASAVVADVIDGVKHLHTNKWVIWEEATEDRVMKAEDCSYRYFVRTSDKTLMDKLPGTEFVGEAEGETVFTTAEMKEADFMDIACGKCAYIRIL